MRKSKYGWFRDKPSPIRCYLRRGTSILRFSIPSQLSNSFSANSLSESLGVGISDKTGPLLTGEGERDGEPEGEPVGDIEGDLERDRNHFSTSF